MKISELILNLEKLKEEHGDIPVFYDADCFWCQVKEFYYEKSFKECGEILLLG